MGASKEKKVRASQRDVVTNKQAAEAEQVLKNKKFRRNTIIVVVVVVLLLAAALVINSDIFYTRTTAVQIGDTKFTPAETSYFYKTAFYSYYDNLYSQFGDMASLLLDVNTPLSEQPYDETHTWADLVYESAVADMERVTVYYEAAIKDGWQVDEEISASVEATLSNARLYAEQNGFSSLDKFLAANYGKGLNEKIFTALMEKVTIATAYSNDYAANLSYTDDQLKTYYAEHADELNYYNYYYFSVSHSNEQFADLDDSAKAEAAHAAATEIATATTPEEFSEKILAFDADSLVPSISSATASALSDNYKEWVMDSSRKAGDTTVVDLDTYSIVVMYVGIDDNNYYPVNMRHILVSALVDENGNYTEEALADAKESAEAIYAEWKRIPDEGVFASMANQYSNDSGSNTNGGLYTDIIKNSMVPEINAFLFDPSREVGDTAVVYGSNSGYAGYHIVYFSGVSEQLYSDMLAENALKTADTSAHYDALAQGYEVVTGSGLKFANIT